MPADLALVAGSGNLPLRIVEACARKGRDLFVLGISGHADPGLPVDAWIRLGGAGRALDLLRHRGIGEVVLAGAVRRPSLTEMRPDLTTLRVLTAALRRAGGDDALLRAVVRAIEAEGFRVIAPETLLDEAILPEGRLGAVPVPEGGWEDIRRGVAVALALGATDVGQGVVVQQAIVLAVEAAEGTDAMLARAGGLRRGGRGGVLVKLAKPGQETRVDRPAIGPATIAAAARAGLSGIAAEAGATLLLDRCATLAAADAAGLFLVGIDARAEAAGAGSGGEP